MNSSEPEAYSRLTNKQVGRLPGSHRRRRAQTALRSARGPFRAGLVRGERRRSLDDPNAVESIQGSAGYVPDQPLVRQRFGRVSVYREFGSSVSTRGVGGPDVGLENGESDKKCCERSTMQDEKTRSHAYSLGDQTLTARGCAAEFLLVRGSLLRSLQSHRASTAKKH